MDQPPPSPIPTPPPAAPVPISPNYQGIGPRLAAQLLDSLIQFFGFGYLIAVIFNQTTSGGFVLSGFPAFIWILVALAYSIIFEGTIGATPGKMLIKIKVVKEDGSKCNLSSALVRNLLRIVDMLPFLYIVGMIVINRSDKKQRLGDKIAHTVVIKTHST